MSKITKKEKTLRKGITQWKNFLNEGAFKPQVQEARMGEYGKIDAEDGNPPSKIGRGNEEYMAAYNAVLQARGEQPLDIQQPDQAYLDALQQGRMKPSDHSYNLEEGNAEFEVGDEVIANGYPGTITDLSIPGMATVALARGEVSVPLNNIEKKEGDGFYKGDFGMELYDIDEAVSGKEQYYLKQQNRAKGAAMALLDSAEEFSRMPSTEPASSVSSFVGRQANIIVDAMVALERMITSNSIDERSEDDERDLEEPVKYGSGAELEWDAKAQKYYDRKRDMYIDDKEEEDNLTKEGDENFSAKTEGAGKSYSTGEQPQEYDTVSLDGEEYEVKMVMPNGDCDISRDGRYGSESLTISPDNLEFISREGEEATFGESNEPFDMDAHMAAYENEPETIEYRKQIKQLVQMVADKKGIPVEQAAEEIASYVVTAGGMKEAIGMQNIEKRRKPVAAPAGQKLSPAKMAMNFIADRGYDSSKIDVMDLVGHMRSTGVRKGSSQEEVNTAVIDFIQKNNISMTEGAGDKEAKIRDVVKMGSWDNIDGVSLSLPQAELLVAAMDNLSPANKEKLMAMPIDKMLDIVNKMVDAGVITVDYGRAGLKEYGDHDAQASGGLAHSSYSSDPELDQIEDIARDMLEAGVQNSRIPVGLNSVASALQAQGFDATVTSGVLNIDGKYFMGKEGKFDISPDEDIRRVMGYVVGHMG